jgi:hypothetical protein
MQHLQVMIEKRKKGFFSLRGEKDVSQTWAASFSSSSMDPPRAKPAGQVRPR